jgi:hypothetical protein
MRLAAIGDSVSMSLSGTTEGGAGGESRAAGAAKRRRGPVSQRKNHRRWCWR